MLNREQVNRIREEYPQGTRLELLEPLEDEFSKLKVGDKGTVRGVDDEGSILMSWDIGSSLSLLVGIDKFKKCE
jgi:hypothetical protein